MKTSELVYQNVSSTICSEPLQSQDSSVNTHVHATNL